MPGSAVEGAAGDDARRAGLGQGCGAGVHRGARGGRPAVDAGEPDAAGVLLRQAVERRPRCLQPSEEGDGVDHGRPGDVPRRCAGTPVRQHVAEADAQPQEEYDATRTVPNNRFSLQFITCWLTAVCWVCGQHAVNTW